MQILAIVVSLAITAAVSLAIAAAIAALLLVAPRVALPALPSGLSRKASNSS